MGQERAVGCFYLSAHADRGVLLGMIARYQPGKVILRHGELLVLDLNLPDGQGLELLGRALELVAGVPVVVLSGHAHPMLAMQMLERGARGYVVKDLDAAEQLQQLVAQLA